MLRSLADSSALMHCPACLTVLFQSLAAPRPLTVWNSFGVSHAPLNSTRRSRALSLPDVRAPRYRRASFSPHVIAMCRSEVNDGASATDHCHFRITVLRQFCMRPISAKLHYTDTGYTDMLYNTTNGRADNNSFYNLLYNKFTTNGQKFATSQHLDMSKCWALALQCGKFLFVGGAFVVQQVVELLRAWCCCTTCPKPMSV